MNAAISRSYDVIVYPYDNDDEQYCAFSISPTMVNKHTIRIFLSCYDDFEDPLYLGLCDDELWFIDTGNRRGLTFPLPNSADQIFDYFEDIDEYDPNKCAVLAETAFILYHDILNPLHSLPEKSSD